MDDTGDQNVTVTNSASSAQSDTSAASVQPNPSTEPVQSVPPSSTPPVQPATNNADHADSPTTPKSPFPLKWALIGVAIVVILTGSLLGILSSSSRKTTTTSAAGTIVTTGGIKWPFGSLPNVLLEKDTLRINTDEVTGEMSIHGQIVFAKHLNSGTECWVVWASTDPSGKLKTRVGTPFPKGNDQLNPPNPPCPKPGGFNTGTGYPAVATRIFGPQPKENEGVLNNPNATPLRYFDIYKVKVPKNTCTLYLNYRSNRQAGVPFYELTLPACQPTPTKVVSTPTPVSPTPFDVPRGCTYVQTYNSPRGANNYSSCFELCGVDVNNRPCTRGAVGCNLGACRAGKSNPTKVTTGAWYCCVRAACDTSCSPDEGQTGCSAGLECLPKKCAKGVHCASQYTCQDARTCSARGDCQCIEQKGVLPTATPTP